MSLPEVGYKDCGFCLGCTLSVSPPECFDEANCHDVSSTMEKLYGRALGATSSQELERKWTLPTTRYVSLKQTLPQSSLEMTDTLAAGLCGIQGQRPPAELCQDF